MMETFHQRARNIWKPGDLQKKQNVFGNLETFRRSQKYLETNNISCYGARLLLQTTRFSLVNPWSCHMQRLPRNTLSVVVIDEVFCIFIGMLENTCDLRRHYGLPRQATEAMVVVEAYKVLRDRAPYPPDQVIKDLQGKFAFILFDARFGTLFAARDRDGSVELQWGMAGDGSLVCSNDPNIIREACGKSCAPFPPGCIFTSVSGLKSFVHPMYKEGQLLAKMAMDISVGLLFRWICSPESPAFRELVVQQTGLIQLSSRKEYNDAEISPAACL